MGNTAEQVRMTGTNGQVVACVPLVTSGSERDVKEALWGSRQVRSYVCVLGKLYDDGCLWKHEAAE
jgi:hypothetical protein